MKRQAYQRPELRDANDNIIQAGTYGKESPLVNGDNTGVLDYINNNLEALRDNINGARIYVASQAKLPATGDISAIYITEDTGKWYIWNGKKYVESDDARKSANEAIAARDAAKAWAESTGSPDGASDTASPTGKTQSSKIWALYSKDQATAAASSAAAALESSSGATAAAAETKAQAQQAAASITTAAALVAKTETNSAIVGEQLKQAQALATANAGIQIYLDDDGDLAYRRIE